MQQQPIKPKEHPKVDKKALEEAKKAKEKIVNNNQMVTK